MWRSDVSTLLHTMAYLPTLRDPAELDVLISELLVATADGYDRGIDDRVTEVLQLLRRELGWTWSSCPSS